MTAPECSELDLFPILDLSGGAGCFADDKAAVWQCLQAFPEGLGMFLNDLRREMNKTHETAPLRDVEAQCRSRSRGK
jgi:hypothetical protein